MQRTKRNDENIRPSEINISSNLRGGIPFSPSKPRRAQILSTPKKNLISLFASPTKTCAPKLAANRRHSPATSLLPNFQVKVRIPLAPSPRQEKCKSIISRGASTMCSPDITDSPQGLLYNPNVPSPVSTGSRNPEIQHLTEKSPSCPRKTNIEMLEKMGGGEKQSLEEPSNEQLVLVLDTVGLGYGAGRKFKYGDVRIERRPLQKRSEKKSNCGSDTWQTDAITWSDQDSCSSNRLLAYIPFEAQLELSLDQEQTSPSRSSFVSLSCSTTEEINDNNPCSPGLRSRSSRTSDLVLAAITIAQQWPHPDWAEDSAFSSCCGEQCSRRTFSLIRRKHHCRSCGLVFCNDCTSQRILMPFDVKPDAKPQRCCDSCFAFLDNLREANPLLFQRPLPSEPPGFSKQPLSSTPHSQIVFSPQSKSSLSYTPSKNKFGCSSPSPINSSPQPPTPFTPRTARSARREWSSPVTELLRMSPRSPAVRSCSFNHGSPRRNSGDFRPLSRQQAFVASSSSQSVFVYTCQDISRTAAAAPGSTSPCASSNYSSDDDLSFDTPLSASNPSSKPQPPYCLGCRGEAACIHSFEGVAYTEGSQSRIESRSDSGAAGGTPSSTLRERLIVSPQTAKHCMLRRQPISSRLISGGTKTNALSPFSPSYRSTCKKASTLSNKEIRHLMNSTRKRLKQQKVKESRSPCSNE